MNDQVLKGHIINGLNEIKKWAYAIDDGGCSQDEIYEAVANIIGEAQDIIDELMKGEE